MLRVLGNIFNLKEFDYESAEEIHHKLKLEFEKMKALPAAELSLDAQQWTMQDEKTIYRIGTIPIYAGDSLVRRAKSLQAAQPILEGVVASIRMHPELAAKLKLAEGDMVTVKQQDSQARLPVHLDYRASARGVVIAGGIAETSTLSDLYGPVEVL